MTFVVAVSGKGGTGKTTFSALTVDYLVKNTGKAVLAVDADSNANLDLALGTEAEKTVGSIREYLTDNISRMPAGMSKEVWVETLMQQALVEEKGFDLLSMGRPEGPGCYCYLNNIFRRYLDIMSGHYEYVVADNEAGMEHLSRRTTRGVDVMFIASDPSVRGIRTALSIRDLARELKLDIKRMALVVTRVRDGLPQNLRAIAEEANLEVAGVIPEDEMIRDFDEQGKALSALPEDSSARQAVNRILDGYLELP
ncbi:MAG: carbon monoxide dehydrogenase [Candidatus Solincola sediminis]|uniref:Carbon monoxide dehydrogenase n=1 Tax=Candidatus Solincola sediminis TaxID=1797199 RepID=A0A1F2WH19_9ACTN|nr:MAG: carbon monoxide dehydrogenase [Candidatus Solincola sediminis]OFW60462.1 MAG: carbon monoxide dehydrogenase [Candidatus Solincola sediminis]